MASPNVSSRAPKKPARRPQKPANRGKSKPSKPSSSRSASSGAGAATRAGSSSGTRKSSDTRPQNSGGPGNANDPGNANAPQDRVTLSSEDRSEASRLPNLGESFPDVGPTAQPDEHFQYTPRNYQDLTDAQYYHPATQAGRSHITGVEANEQINQDYHQANQDMQRYLAGDPNGEQLPPVADWMTFGKFASREAGEVIRNTEDAIEAYHGDAKAVTDLARNGVTQDNVVQGAMAGGMLAQNAAANNGANIPGASGEVGGKGMETLHDVHNGFVEGNTEIHQNIAPAYDAFLNGEAKGTDGMKALEEAGYTKGSEKDPQGFVSGAFSNYQQARELGLQAQQEKDPAKKQQMLKDRQKLMEKGNLMLGMQEQMEILQQPGIFGNQNVRNAVGSIGGTMGITDANGRHSLLPNGGDWSDFQTRMGLQSVAPGTAESIPVTDKNGKTTHYLPDPNQKGTIVDYFTQNAAGQRAANLNANMARPTEIAPSTPTGESLDGIGQGLNSGDANQVVANGLALAPRVVSDVVGAGGDGLSESGTAQVSRGQDNWDIGSQRGGFDGVLEQAAGASEIVQGRVKQGAGAAGRFASRQAERFGDHVEDVVDSYKNGVVWPWDKRAKWWF